MKQPLTRNVLPVIALALCCAFAACTNVPTPWVNGIRSPQYFALYVEDVDRVAEWYCVVFGLEKLGGSEAEDGAWRIENLGSRRILVEIIRDSRAQSVERAHGFRKVGFYVTDLDAVAQRIEEAIGKEIQIFDFEELNQRFLQIHDPEGNTVQLFSSKVKK
jgi:predicted enzyme related to lactoylglutathione lyase